MTYVLTLRKMLVSLGVLGLLGLAAELAAVGHWYGPGQLMPFLAIVVGVLASAWYLIADGARSRLALRVTAALLVVAGLWGALEHTGVNPRLRQDGRAGESAVPPEAKPGESGLFGLPAPTPNWLNGPAPVSAPLALSGLGVLLLAALYRREADAAPRPPAPVGD